MQSVLGLIAVAFGFLLDISKTEWVAICIIIGLVLAFETFNSAIESIVNLVSPEYHPLAGKIKDLAAGAVLILSITSVVIGLLIFIPYLLPLLPL